MLLHRVFRHQQGKSHCNRFTVDGVVVHGLRHGDEGADEPAQPGDASMRYGYALADAGAAQMFALEKRSDDGFPRQIRFGAMQQRAERLEERVLAGDA